MHHVSTHNEAGFSDAARDGQKAFRAVMDAMARPGLIVGLDGRLTPPTALNIAAASVALALCDYETRLWLSPSLRQSVSTGAYITFHTGAPRTADEREAAFALLDLRSDAFELSNFAQGTAEYPDRSTTIIAMCGGLDAGGGFRLSGPGIKHEARLDVQGLPMDFARQWAFNRAGFPLGVDVIFCCGNRLACLPRSTRLVEGDA
jgi:alpha-D-ribose 1-methylphosphonate 5-triphosphate synthase subunit PhnH